MFIASSISLFLLVACGTASYGGGSTRVAVISTQESKSDIPCQEKSNLSALDNQPIYNFGGLTSNWYHAYPVSSHWQVLFPLTSRHARRCKVKRRLLAQLQCQYQEDFGMH